MADIDPGRPFGIGRRTLLATGLAMTGDGSPMPGWAREPMFNFPDSTTLRRLIQPAIGALGAAAQVEHLGYSANGKPIEMISIGSGERSALIVGAPAVGGALFLIDKLIGDRVARFASVKYTVKGPWKEPKITFDKPF